jgi:hypothetical protein
MTFDSLPTELKLNILEELHIAGTQDRNHRHFTNALRVCKEWNELGAPLLWTYIAINNDNLLPFVRSLGTARNTTGAIVRNLSIKLNPMPQGALFSLSLTRLGFPSDHWDDEARSSTCLLPCLNYPTPAFHDFSVITRTATSASWSR